MANGLKCTDMCKLQDCENQTSRSEDDEETNIKLMKDIEGD